MKAPTWRLWLAIAAGTAASAVATAGPSTASPALGSPSGPVSGSPGSSQGLPGLPLGLPGLPSLGQAMQSDASSGLALSGYDPVAYQAQGRAVPGRAEYELVHRDAVWRFASAANRAAFLAAPEVYEPAFAGFDATGVAEGRAVETDPRQFAIVDSRLFLFRTQQNRASFVADASLLGSADAQWEAVSAMLGR